jgi:hypothetical protein
MKKELIQEVKRIKQIMNINEGWGNVFRDSFQAMVSSGRIDRIKDVLETLENMQAIDLQTNVSLRRELTSNADTFEDALDTIAKKIERLSDQSDFNKAFDEFIDSLDSSSATKISDDIRKIENASSQDVSDNIKSSITTNMDPEMAKLYKKRLDSVTWKGSNSVSPSTANSSVLERANNTFDNLMNDDMFKKMYPDKSIRETLIKEVKDLVNTGNIQFNTLQEVNDYLLKMQPRYDKLAQQASAAATSKNYNQIKATQEAGSKVRVIIDEFGKTGEEVIGKGSDIISKGIEGTGKIAKSGRRNIIPIFTCTILGLVALGIYRWSKSAQIVGPLIQGGKEEGKEIIKDIFETVDETVKDNGGTGIPEVVDEKPPKEETKPAETTPVVKTPKTSQDSIDAGLKGAWD